MSRIFIKHIEDTKNYKIQNQNRSSNQMLTFDCDYSERFLRFSSSREKIKRRLSFQSLQCICEVSNCVRCDCIGLGQFW